MREKLEYFAVLGFLSLAKITPISWLYSILNMLSVLLCKLLKKRRELAIKNISKAYTDFSEKDAYDLAKRNFQSISKTVTEALLIYHDRYNIDENIINKDETLKLLKDLTCENKKGVVFISMHFGNWEILAYFLAQNGYPAVGIGRKGDNELIEKNITIPFREKHGNANVYKKQAMVKLIRTLRKGGNIGLLMDQKTNYQNSVKTTFFQRKCLTTSSVSMVKLKYNALIIPIFLKRIQNGKYEVIIDMPNLNIDEDKSDEDNMIQITQELNNILEKTVRQAPEQWFWMHDRWKYS